MDKVVGKKDNFTAIFDANRQEYRVYKDGRYLITKHRYRDVKIYIT